MVIVVVPIESPPVVDNDLKIRNAPLRSCEQIAQQFRDGALKQNLTNVQFSIPNSHPMGIEN
jgi:hypothetical protein